MDMCYLACAYRTPSGYCGSTGGAATCPHRQKTPTNADRIRRMTDEELAECIAYRIHACYGCEAPDGSYCKQCWLDWLKGEKIDD